MTVKNWVNLCIKTIPLYIYHENTKSLRNGKPLKDENILSKTILLK
jgi:hypothetical protein